jgi:hypothetical protein
VCQEVCFSLHSGRSGRLILMKRARGLSRRQFGYSLSIFNNTSKASVVSVRFHVLTASSKKMTAFWDVSPCSLMEVDRHFTRPDDGDNANLRNFGLLPRDCTALHPRKLPFSRPQLFTFYVGILLDRSRVSSGSIVSDYGLDDRAIGVRSPAGAKDFSSNLCVQTGSGAHPASCTVGTGGPFPGGKSAAGA